MAGLRARARYPKELLAKCRLKVLAWARKESMQLSADDISASHSPDWGVRVGQPLKVMAKQCWEYQRAAARYVETVAERVAARLGATDSSELARLRDSLREARVAALLGR